MEYLQKLQSLGIEAKKSGKYLCPECSINRKNKSDKCLSVSFKSDSVVWLCHNCSWKGSVPYQIKPQKRFYRPSKPVVKDNKAPLYKYWECREIAREVIDKFKVELIDGNIMVFPYYKNGELVNIKYRKNLGDGKKQIWNTKPETEEETEKVLFGMDLVDDFKEVVICEGEPDALSFWQAGVQAVSVPNGAKEKELSWIENCWDWLQQFDSYVIAADSDKDGAVMIDNLIKRLDKYKCKILSYGQYKDANDALMNGREEELREMVAKAKMTKNENIIDFYDELDHVLNFYEEGYVNGLSTGFEGLDRIFTIKPSYLMVITGYPSRGKSYFTDNLLLNLSEKSKWKHLVASFETAKDIYFGNMASQYKEKTFTKRNKWTPDETAETIEFISEHFYLLDPEIIWNIDMIIEQARYSHKRYGINTLVIDPYSCLDKDLGYGRETDYIQKMLMKLKALAKELNILVIMVAHPAKVDSDKPPNLYSISGSAHWFNFADYGVVVHRNKDEETGKFKGFTDVIVEKVKNRHIGDTSGGKIQVYIPPNKWRVKEYNPVPKSYWGGTVNE